MKRSIRRIVSLFLAIMIVTTVVFSASSKTFNDVDQNKWYAPYIDYVLEHELMSGVGKTSFSPNGIVTRAQFVTTLYALAEKPETEGKPPFKDLKEGAYYINAVNWASSTGVTSGMSEESFAPDKNVTREQAATFFRAFMMKIYRYDDVLLPKTSIRNFADRGNVSKFAYESMRWAVGVGVISGIRNGNGQMTLQPQGGLTRAQLATMLRAFKEYVEGNTIYIYGKKTDDNNVPQSGSRIEILQQNSDGSNRVLWSCVTESDGKYCATLPEGSEKEKIILRCSGSKGQVLSIDVPMRSKHILLNLTDSNVYGSF